MISAPVSIAVVSYNTRELLRACLDAAIPSVEAGLANVVVVDNDSSDGSAEMVASSFPQLGLLTPGENLGFGRAVNLAAGESTSEWLAIANADTALQAGALESLIAAGSADPSLGALAPRLVMPSGATQHSVHPFPSVSLGVAFNLGLYHLPGAGERMCIEGWWNPERARDVEWALGAFLLVRRRAFEEIGGFDAEQWLYAEDIDLQWRLRRAGWRTRYEPTAAVRHEVSAATRAEFGDQRAARHVAATYAWLARRQGLIRTWIYALANTVGSGARAAALLPLARLAPGRFRDRRDRATQHTRLHARGLRGRRTLLAAAPQPRPLAPTGEAEPSPVRKPPS